MTPGSAEAAKKAAEKAKALIEGKKHACRLISNGKLLAYKHPGRPLSHGR